MGGQYVTWATGGLGYLYQFLFIVVLGCKKISSPPGERPPIGRPV